LDIPG
jgi:glutamyl-tRNA reductase